MEEKAILLETLLEKTEAYVKTNVDLFKLKAIDKSAEVVSSLAAKLIMVIVGSLIVIIANIGLALWIGDVMGKSYYGFFMVAFFYLVVLIIIYAFSKTLIKDRVSDSMISQLLNEKHYEKGEAT